MNIKKIYDIISHFLNPVEELVCEELSVGYINKTYLITNTLTDKKYVLQCINHEVFSNINQLMQNANTIYQHLNKKNKRVINHRLKPIVFLNTLNKTPYFTDLKGQHWRMMEFIPHKTIQEDKSSVLLACEAGQILGLFHFLTSDLNPQSLHVIIDHFHHIDHYFKKLEELQSRNNKRFQKTISIYRSIINYKHLVLRYQSIKSKLPLRVTHNDPKLTNILFNQKLQAISIIDWDTIMPGHLMTDFGDAIRSFCNTSDENEKDLNLVNFDIHVFKLYTESYLKIVNDMITTIEKENLAFFVLIITLEQAIRFYKDYLEYDVYYKIAYPNHNLIRAKVQLKLLNQMYNQYENMRAIINNNQAS